MKMGESVRYDSEKRPIIRPPTENEKFVINNKILEKVDRFKFLGFWLLSNGNNSEHIKKRTQMAWTEVADIEKLGFNNPKLDIEIKGNLLNVFVRPKLSYGLENAYLNENDIRYLEKIEGIIIKKSCDFTSGSYSKPIIRAMKIQTIRSMIAKRNISLLKQLMENSLTRKIVLMDLPGNPTGITMKEIGLNIDLIKEYNDLIKSSIIISKCLEKIKYIDEEEKRAQNNEYQQVINYLFKNMTTHNHRVLSTLLDSWEEART